MAYESAMELKPLVAAILRRPFDFKWTLQGLGMLRTYIEPDLRLHVWDSRYRTPGVSAIHTHPWHFHSTIVAGAVRNLRLDYADSPLTTRYNRQKVLCGPGGGLVEGSYEVVRLRSLPGELYGEGEVYSQRAHEIHYSAPVDGTVTLVRKEPVADADHGYVFWAGGDEFVTAEPRTATGDEVYTITRGALERWFS